MATQFTPILKLALPVQGELTGNWGNTVNDSITSMVEEAVAGRSVINIWSTNSATLSVANGAAASSWCGLLCVWVWCLHTMLCVSVLLVTFPRIPTLWHHIVAQYCNDSVTLHCNTIVIPRITPV